MLEAQLTSKLNQLKNDELLEAMKMHFRVYCKARIEARKRKLIQFAAKKQYDDFTIVSTMLKSNTYNHCARQLGQNLSGSVLDRYKRLKQRHNVLFISEKLHLEDNGDSKVLKFMDNGKVKTFTAKSNQELIKLAGIIEPNEIDYIMDAKNKKSIGNTTKIAALATPKKGAQKLAVPVKKAAPAKAVAKPAAKNAAPAKAAAKPAAKKAVATKTAAKPAAKKAAPAKKAVAKPAAKKAVPAKKAAAKPAVKKAAPAKKAVAKPAAKKAAPAKKAVAKPAAKKAAPAKKVAAKPAAKKK